MDQFPKLCLAIIFYECPVYKIQTFSLVCKNWYQVIKEIVYYEVPQNFSLKLMDWENIDLFENYDKIEPGSVCFFESESIGGQSITFSFVVVSVKPEGINIYITQNQNLNKNQKIK